jgi:hypothetical protein
MTTYIPARYVGESPVILRDGQRKFLDGDGKPRATNLLSPGDTLMMPATEIYGMTFKRDTRDGPARLLGVGRVFLPGDEDRDLAELRAEGYEFHDGRPDFVPIEGDTSTAQDTPAAPAPAASAAPATIATKTRKKAPQGGQDAPLPEEE